MTPTVVVLHYGRKELTEACLARLDGCDVVVVDNQGDWPNPTVRPSHNLGFAAGCNLGAEHADGDPLIFLNNDCEVPPNWLEPLLAPFDDPQVGIVGCQLRYPNGDIAHAGVKICFGNSFGWEARNLHMDLGIGVYEAPAVTGACMAVRRDTFKQLGGFDTGFWNGYEDIDLCLAAREAGWKVIYTPDCVVMHHESQANPKERFGRARENTQRLRDKWGDG